MNHKELAEFVRTTNFDELLVLRDGKMVPIQRKAV